MLESHFQLIYWFFFHSDLNTRIAITYKVSYTFDEILLVKLILCFNSQIALRQEWKSNQKKDGELSSKWSIILHIL